MIGEESETEQALAERNRVLALAVLKMQQRAEKAERERDDERAGGEVLAAQLVRIMEESGMTMVAAERRATGYREALERIVVDRGNPACWWCGQIETHDPRCPSLIARQALGPKPGDIHPIYDSGWEK